MQAIAFSTLLKPRLMLLFPAIGRLSNFSHPQLTQVRQYQIKGFTKYIIFYQIQSPETVEILRVLHGAQDLEFILTPDE